MYAKLTIFALVALVAACQYAQAGLVETNNNRAPPMPRYEPEDEEQYAPPSYESLQPAGAYPASAQQYPSALPVPMAPQVYQAQQGQQAQPQQARQPGQFRAHLRELGKSGVTSGRRALAEARPALNGLRSDLNGLASSVMNNPKVSKLVQATKPKVEGVKARAHPLVEKSSRRIGDLAARAQQRLANRGQQHKQQQGGAGGLAPVLEDPAESYDQSEIYPPAYQHNTNGGRFVQ